MDNGEQTLRMIVLASPEPMPTLVEPQTQGPHSRSPGLGGNFAGRNPNALQRRVHRAGVALASVTRVTRAEVEGRVGHPSGTAMYTIRPFANLSRAGEGGSELRQNPRLRGLEG
jgi:hypothetical protein